MVDYLKAALFLFLFIIIGSFPFFGDESKDITLNNGKFTISEGLIYQENFLDKYENFVKDRYKKSKTAPYFNGTSDKIIIANSFSNLKEGTISLWVKCDNSPTQYEPLKIFYEIVSGEPNKYLDGDWGLALYNDFVSGFTFAIYGEDKKIYFLSSNFFPVLGKWYNLVAKWGKDGMQVYIDGTLYSKNSYEGTFDKSNDKIFYGVGTFINSSFRGAIDDVLVYNRTLTVEEIKLVYDKNSVKSNNMYSILDVTDISDDRFNYSLTYDRLKSKKNAFKFDGVSDYLVVYNDMEDITNGTVSVWVRFDDYAFNEEQLKIFFEIVSGSPGKIAPGDWGLALFLHNSTGISFGIYNSKSGPYFSNSNFFPLLGKWYNITATWGKGGMKLYINGVLRVKNDFTGSFDTYQNKFFIGTGTFPKSFFNGAVDDLIIYERELSETEINKTYKDFSDELKRIKDLKKIELPKIDFKFNVKKEKIPFEIIAKNYRKNMIIAGITTGVIGLAFIGISPLFLYFSNYYKSYYNITNYFYENSVTKERVDYYYDILKYYSNLNNAFVSLSIIFIPIGVTFSITSFILFILQNYYIKDNKIIDLNLFFDAKENIGLSVGIKL